MVNWNNLQYDDRKNCLENCVYNISMIFDSPFYPIYVDYWDFILEPRKMDGSKYIIDEIEKTEDDYLMNFQNNCGVSFKRLKPSKEVLSDCSLYNEQRIMIGRINIFECFWSPFYKKLHYPHYFFIQCLKGDILMCSDPFYKKNLLELQYDKTVDKLFLFERQENNTYDIKNGIYIQLNKMKAEYDKKAMFNLIRNFADLVGKVDNIKEISNDEIIDNVFLVQRLNNIKGNRYHFSQLLNQVEYKDEAELMEQVAQDWSEVCILLMKAIINKRVTLCPRIKRQLLSIADAEEAIYHKLLKRFESYGITDTPLISETNYMKSSKTQNILM